MRTLLERISRRLDLVSPGHATALLALLWLLTIIVTWLVARGAA